MTVVENELFHDIQKGDKRALKALFDLYYTALCRFSLKLCNNEEIAEEVVQDVFVALWQKRKNLSLHSSLKAYLYQATRNRTINYLKSSIYLQTHANISHEGYHVAAAEGADDICRGELQQLLEKAVRKLPVKSATIFSLSRHTDLTNKQIAEKLNISVKTVEYHISASLKEIRKLLERYGYIILFFWP